MLGQIITEEMASVTTGFQALSYDGIHASGFEPLGLGDAGCEAITLVPQLLTLSISSVEGSPK